MTNSVRTTTGSLFSNSGIPAQTAFSACGWFKLRADTNAQQCVFSLEEADGGSGRYIILATDTDGTTLQLFASPDSPVTVRALAVDTVYFWSITSSGGGAGNTKVYIRSFAETSLSSVSLNRTSAVWTAAQMWLANDKFTQPMNGCSANFKCWDSVLSEAEVLAESYSQAPIISSPNRWTILESHTDLSDSSGNGRSWTGGGTLSTEDIGQELWGSPFTLTQVGQIGLVGTLVISGDIAVEAVIPIEPVAPIALTGSLAITGDLLFEVLRWRIPTNAPAGTEVHVTILNGSGNTYTEVTQGRTTVNADGHIYFPAQGAVGMKLLAFVHNYDDDTETTSIYGGPCIATIVDVG